MMKLKMLDARPTDRAPNAGEAWPLAASEPFSGSLQFRSSSAGKRRPIVVKLPDDTELNLDSVTNGLNGYTVHDADKMEAISVDEVLIGRRGWKGHLHKGQLLSEKEYEQATQKQSTSDAGPSRKVVMRTDTP